MTTPPIIASIIQEFASLNELNELKQSEQFEHLLAHLLLRGVIHDRFSTNDVTTGDGETGVDAACIVLDGNLILTTEDAEQFFKQNKPSSSVVADLHFIQAKLSQNFSRTEILGFGAAVHELLRQSETQTTQDEYLTELGEIFKLLLKNAAKLDLKRASCSFSYCCLGEWKDQEHPAKAIQRVRNDICSLDFFAAVHGNAIDRNAVRDLWSEATRAHEATLPTVARFPFPAMPGVDNAVVALVKAKDFVDQVVRDKSQKVRPNIFDQNIRDFEGLANPVNKNIKSTLESDDGRCRFGIMNNGVTIVAKDMKPAADSYILRSFQIINGCQTSNVLERSRSSLTDSVLLQVRLIQTTAAPVLDDVVQATNSQTTVPDHQFAANTRLAVEVQDFFASYPEDTAHRLHFERRKSELADAGISNTRVVTIQDLARTFGAIFLEEPHLVASAPNQAYASFRDRLFSDGDSPLMYYTAAFAHYRLCLLRAPGKLKIPHHRLYWHVLTASKRLAAGTLPSGTQSRKKQDAYCEKFLERLWEPADALSLFESAYTAIKNNTKQIDRDRLRRPTFTQEYLSCI